MKKFKKIFGYLLLVVLSLFLTGCVQTNNYSDLKKALNDTIESISSKYDLDNITDNLELSGTDDRFIYKFISSNENVISSSGIVNRQVEQSEVIITVRVYENELFVQDSFKCVVLPIEITEDYTKLRQVLDNTISNITTKYDLNNITDNLELKGADSSYIYQFTSSNPQVISNDGKVTIPSVDTTVVITVKVTKNDYSVQDTFECVVKAKVITDGYTYDVKNTKSKLKVSDLNKVNENGEYNNYLDVVAYLYYFHKLPKNYLTKSQAKSLGWKGSGNVWVNDNLRGKNIGGDVFNNYEQVLPILSNSPYVEVDVNCSGGSRGKYRIVYNKYTFDIYYTDDHYETFTYMIGQVK